MLNKAIAIAAWACLVFVAFATLSPLDMRPELLAGGPYKALATAAERFGHMRFSEFFFISPIAVI
jgi:hypothetical protein